MRINGFQKMTLLDYPGKVACTVFTGGCNFRCPFCHNAGLVTGDDNETYTEEEILGYLSKRQGILDGVCITGGEPLLQPDIEEFIGMLKAMGYLVKLDTNGSFPEKLISLTEKGLIDYVAMDVKNCMERYGETVGIASFSTAPIEKSIKFLLSGAVDYEFRTTVTRELHREEDIEALAQYIGGAKKYFLQQFVDSGNILGENITPHTPETLGNMRKIAKAHIQNVELRGI